MQNISDAAMFTEVSPDSVVRVDERGSGYSNLDTSFVLFFLSLDLGQNWFEAGLGAIIALFTVAAFAVLPYFLSGRGEGTGFAAWLLGRLTLVVVGVMLGLMLKLSIGVLLPESVTFLPMTLLIVAAIICCNRQIYGILTNRLAR